MIKQEENKSYQNWKGNKIVFVEDMISYIENPKDSTKKLLDLINEFNTAFLPSFFSFFQDFICQRESERVRD